MFSHTRTLCVCVIYYDGVQPLLLSISTLPLSHGTDLSAPLYTPAGDAIRQQTALWLSHNGL